MNTTDAMVNGWRFTPDGEPQEIGNSKFALMLSQRSSGDMFFDVGDEHPVHLVAQVGRDEEDDEE